MSERTSSFLILFGGTLAVLAVWALSVLAVRWDTRRRGLPDFESKIWIGLAVALPLFGFALSTAIRILRGYLLPPPDESPEEARLTAVQTRDDMAWSAHGSSQRGSLPTNPAAQPQIAQRYSLVTLEGPHIGQQFIINKLPARIGRGSDAAIPLDADLNVSRSHAEVYAWYGSLRIRDLRSAHGTQINDSPVSDQPIAPGDRIRVGDSTLILRDIS